MRLTPLLATLFVAGATVATAEPDKPETAARVSYIAEGAAPQQAGATPRDGDLIELATPTPAKHGKEFIQVGAAIGKFSKLRVDAHSGRVVVRSVRVDLASGKSRTFTIDREVDAKHRVTIDLGAAVEIERLVITTQRTAGDYTVSGIYGGSGEPDR